MEAGSAFPARSSVITARLAEIGAQRSIFRRFGGAQDHGTDSVSAFSARSSVITARLAGIPGWLQVAEAVQYSRYTTRWSRRTNRFE
jgi:hypothetical protein